MRNIVFYEGDFSAYKKQQLNEARGEIMLTDYYCGRAPISVFISHKHDDIEDLSGLIGFLKVTIVLNVT